ncbi:MULTISPECIES: 3-hydroxyanthranilate 3,4-dioxygenase [unclassified Microbacterium]|jgi:3-hydroxyanthranilate 3,4-dioxygenase|uniref:3-hydroxyanthranilate 3,4-dioxygenase n=1 Tax=unclassified Microbacterium TaxID=2609290 RepID=UPI000CFD901E|nr:MULTISPECIES: 3-hydroxyanthranilate 3,4-dioxygenase [unclassified Microbacterium]PQZ58107.1 3-hydroxyanthranilate 3,4-dioxygenase [Microbacterium sp. MYb43]PQZ80678.1 3-hydroxyanthranilate 3,4-dioxygenase [Microbacterium sp. MYb40]PRB18381.1 3-hydroxyanthranilate 3,4-dioxygenase [Microbacterium sp. MYb62]PRB20394.1 3-hydroxyanthranilate 3,4-dioxygenase [Microbacterium sp. MYb54]PRB32065.1 3-hydroxyanthranilate 3,4-dioxygenase [Microbacterium sp. MYb50]
MSTIAPVIPPVIDFPAWIKENEHLLKPPVNNKAAWTPMGDFIVQVVGGPNQRTDFHFDPYEEWFYQYRGNMHVNIQTPDGLQRIDIREGEMWLLPGNVFHSPQRPEEGSIGIVIERIREEGTLEKFAWFCPNCNAKVHEVELQVRDIVEDLPPVFRDFYESEEGRTCPECGAVHPGKG